MSDLRFEWDPVKAASNRRKHGVTFDEAATAFADEQGVLIADPDHSADEDRFILLGMSGARRLLVVVHVVRERDTVIRIVSARKATRSERQTYDERWR
jgi:uncharacterized DUF497 family protein